MAVTLPALIQTEIDRLEAGLAERDDALVIPRAAAQLLHALVLSGGFRRGLEVGTSYGYSGLWLAAALKHNGGELVTVEREAHKVRRARESFERAGLAGDVQLHEGDASRVLPGLEGPFDFVFLDADKAGTRGTFEQIRPKLAHNATIVTNNAVSHAEALGEFLAYVRSQEHMVSVLIEVGRGLELTIKLDPYATPASLDGADWVI